VRVLALDPGERVGWAAGVASVTGQEPAELHVTAHGIDYLKDCALAVHQAVAIEKRYDVVVYETYRLTAKGARVLVGSDLQPAQFIGMVRLSCWLAGVKLVPQGPKEKSSALKSMKSHPSGADIQARLDKMPKSHDDGHDGDALLHLWHWFWARYA
jgi:hypothetical protein